MNRIAEIKDRLHQYRTAPRDGVPKGLPWDTIQVIGKFADNAPDDVEYLLAKLEQAEKALVYYDELYKNLYHDIQEGELIRSWLERQGETAREALAAIRS